jgi:hypothetical protein
MLDVYRQESVQRCLGICNERLMYPREQRRMFKKWVQARKWTGHRCSANVLRPYLDRYRENLLAALSAATL